MAQSRCRVFEPDENFELEQLGSKAFFAHPIFNSVFSIFNCFEKQMLQP